MLVIHQPNNQYHRQKEHNHPSRQRNKKKRNQALNQTPNQDRLVPHFFYPTLCVLFLITFTKPLPERLGLSRKFKGRVRIRVKDTGWMR